MPENLPFPPEVLAQHAAALGKTGAGKTTTAKLLVEQVAGSGSRVCILDPVKSDWWGITSSADGKSPGLPFHILGGPHGHVPLHSGAGRAIGEIVASGALPLSILDMREFEPGGHARFFADFAHALTQRMRGVLYLVIEESHIFAPKERSGLGVETQAIHYAKMLATAGRSMGIRLVLLTQRTQALHNALLGSCDTLIAHRLTAPADQKPVLDWLKANVEKTVGDTIAASLASLKTGTGWICSGEAKLFRLVEFPRIKTYDNTATPTEDQVRQRVTTAPVDMAKLRAVIGSAVEEAKENDPEELKKKVAELQREVTRARSSASSPAEGEGRAGPDLDALEDAARAEGYQDGLDDGRREQAAESAEQIRELRAAIKAAAAYLAPLAVEDGVLDVRPPPAPPTIDHAPPPRHRLTNHASAAPPPPHRPAKSSDGSLHAAARAMLAALAQHAPARFTWQQTATLAGLKARGGHFNAGRKDLIERGLIAEDGGLIAASKAGLKEAGTVPPKPTAPREIVDMWCGRLPAPAPEMLRYIVQQGGRAVPRDELAAALGKQPHGGHWNGGVANLRNNGLVETVGNALKPAALLLEARR